MLEDHRCDKIFSLDKMNPGKHFERYFNAEKASEISCALNPVINNFNKEFPLKTCREIIKDNSFKQNLKIFRENEYRNCLS